MMSKILIIEDEFELVKILKGYLQNSGFEVVEARRGDQGLALFETFKPDAILLDLNLPGMDGLDIARIIRRQSDIPILMITARVDETDRLIGLELGADDYIIKPFSPREVVARVKAVLRRSSRMPNSQQVINIQDLTIDPVAHTVTKENMPLELTPIEFSLLLTLSSQPGRAFSRLQLLESVQGNAYVGYERTIDAHIKNLRAKLEPDPKNPNYIETVFGIGYRFKQIID